MVTPVELRAEHYDALFRGELPYESLPEDGYRGIAELCRTTRRSGTRSELLLDHLRQQAPHFIFTQHEFHEGIAFYQAEHPRLSARKPVLANDYANFYASLDSQDLSDKAEPSA